MVTDNINNTGCVKVSSLYYAGKGHYLMFILINLIFERKLWTSNFQSNFQVCGV